MKLLLFSLAQLSIALAVRTAGKDYCSVSLEANICCSGTDNRYCKQCPGQCNSPVAVDQVCDYSTCSGAEVDCSLALSPISGLIQTFTVPSLNTATDVTGFNFASMLSNAHPTECPVNHCVVSEVINGACQIQQSPLFAYTVTGPSWQVNAQHTNQLKGGYCLSCSSIYQGTVDAALFTSSQIFGVFIQIPSCSSETFSLTPRLISETWTGVWNTEITSSTPFTLETTWYQQAPVGLPHCQIFQVDVISPSHAMTVDFNSVGANRIAFIFSDPILVDTTITFAFDFHMFEKTTPHRSPVCCGNIHTINAACKKPATHDTVSIDYYFPSLPSIQYTGWGAGDDPRFEVPAFKSTSSVSSSCLSHTAVVVPAAGSSGLQLNFDTTSTLKRMIVRPTDPTRVHKYEFQIKFLLDDSTYYTDPTVFTMVVGCESSYFGTTPTYAETYYIRPGVTTALIFTFPGWTTPAQCTVSWNDILSRMLNGVAGAPTSTAYFSNSACTALTAICDQVFSDSVSTPAKIEFKIRTGFTTLLEHHSNFITITIACDAASNEVYFKNEVGELQAEVNSTKGATASVQLKALLECKYSECCGIFSYSVSSSSSSSTPSPSFMTSFLMADPAADIFNLTVDATQLREEVLYLHGSNQYGSTTSQKFILKIYEPYEPQNARPVFAEDLQNIEISFGEVDDDSVIVQLPEVLDFEGDPVTVVASTSSKLVKPEVSQGDLLLDISQLENRDEEHMIEVDLELKDTEGGSSEYTLTITFVPEDETASDFEGVKDPSSPQEGQDNSDGQIPEVDENGASRQNVTGKIQFVNYFGEFNLVFNSSLRILSLADVNESALNVSIVPSPQRAEGFDSSTLNMTWQALFVDKNTSLRIKMSLQHPQEISPEVDQDTLQVEFLPRGRQELFYFPDVDNRLHESSWVLKSKIKRQLPDTTLTRSVQTAAEATSGSLLVLFIVSVLLNFVLTGASMYMLILIHALQIILHIPMMRVVLPANVSLVFASTMSVATFDLLDADWTTRLILPFDDERQEKLSPLILDQLRDMGYETHNSILNLGSLSIFTGLYILQILIYGCMALSCGKALSTKSDSSGTTPGPAPKSSRLRQSISNWGASLFYGQILALLFEAYFEFLISGYLQVKQPLTSTLGEVLGVGCGYLSLGLVLGFLSFALGLVGSKSTDELYNDKFSSAWGELYGWVQIKNSGTKSYLAWFAFRRLAMVALAFLPSGYFQFQIFGLLVLNFISMTVVVHVKPLLSRQLNRLETFNEVGVSSIGIWLLLFTRWNPEQAQHYAYGWALIIMLALLIIVNLFFILKVGLHQITLIIRHLYRRSRLYLHLKESHRVKKEQTSRSRAGKLGQSSLGSAKGATETVLGPEEGIGLVLKKQENRSESSYDSGVSGDSGHSKSINSDEAEESEMSSFSHPTFRQQLSRKGSDLVTGEYSQSRGSFFKQKAGLVVDEGQIQCQDQFDFKQGPTQFNLNFDREAPTLFDLCQQDQKSAPKEDPLYYQELHEKPRIKVSKKTKRKPKIYALHGEPGEPEPNNSSRPQEKRALAEQNGLSKWNFKMAHLLEPVVQDNHQGRSSRSPKVRHPTQKKSPLSRTIPSQFPALAEDKLSRRYNKATSSIFRKEDEQLPQSLLSSGKPARLAKKKKKKRPAKAKAQNADDDWHDQQLEEIERRLDSLFKSKPQGTEPIKAEQVPDNSNRSELALAILRQEMRTKGKKSLGVFKV